MFSRLLRIFKATGREITVLWYACRHPATPLFVKLAAALLLMYVISPIDLVPDALPVLGWIDDVTLLAFGIPAILKLIPGPALTEAHSSSERLLSRWAFWRTRI
ncbi:MAG: YkvA family protein [Pseudomonadota bacterium]